MQKYTYIDLFAGCGGLSLGLYKASWKGLFAIEKSPMAFETLKYNLIDKKNHFQWPSWLPQKAHNINNVLKKYSSELKSLQGKIDLVVGGPPCQGFSFAGRRKEKDGRNKLIDSYTKFIEIVKPKVIFFENVKGFTIGFRKKNFRGKAYSNYVTKKLEELGYKIESKIIDFSEYGIPQRRKRFILVGTKKGDPKYFFDNIIKKKLSFLQDKNLTEKASVKDAISDLERKGGEIISTTFKGFREGVYSKSNGGYQRFLKKGYGKKYPDSHRFPNHNKNTINKFKLIQKKCLKNKTINEEMKKLFKLKKRCVILLDESKRSPTLTTLPDDYIHYSEPRILTVREYARIQSFDDWFEFRSKYTTGGKQRRIEVPRYTQVGNAIPPLFGELSGKVLKEMI